MLAPFVALALVASSLSVSASPASLPLSFNRRSEDLPEGVFYFPPSSFAYTPGNITRLQTALWVPPNTTANASLPSFQAFHPDFLTLLGDSPSLKIIAENDTYAFAHEAAIWNSDTNEVIFSANAGGPLGDSNIDKNNKVFKIALNGYDGNASLPFIEILPPAGQDIEMVNGGTPFRGQLLFTCQGRGSIPPSLTLVSPYPPYNSTVLLNNYFGRTFNSVNDLQVHKPSGKIFFTDTLYGYLQDFRPYPTLPEQVYSFDPDTGVVRAVADNFGHVNGISFSPDYSKVYLADTGAANGTFDAYLPATVYVFDVETSSSGAVTFGNRKLFAYADTGVPDGLKVDTSGNVYVGCGDGVHVWNPDGDLLGKIFLGTGSANLAFAGDAGLVILAETKIFLAKFGASAPDLWSY
ncbi:hypothetical protein BDY24DRAFT_399927 [Mrakia frigida]|uniref:SMP-30/gluconolactonase/LRE family protein n=1 Tax=Mrakia frigida TaxID=29902 RepID=UPI003FCBFE98